jgi:hypothetical protein
MTELIEGFDTQGLIEGAMNVSDLVFTGLVIGIILLIGVIIFWYFFMYLPSFKHKIKLRHRTAGGTDIIHEDLFRYRKKKGQSEKIQLRYLKENKPIPPDEARDVTTKGLDYFEGYITDTGEITWVTHANKPGKIEFNSLDTDDKEFYINEVIEAEKLYKNNNIWAFLNQHAGLFMIVFMLVLVFAFWEDITKPMIQLNGQNAEIATTNAQTTKMHAQTTKMLQEILQNKQIMLDEQAGFIEQPKDPPPN